MTTTVPPSPDQRNFVFSTSTDRRNFVFDASSFPGRDELVRRRGDIVALRTQADTVDQCRNWDHAERQIARELRRYEPCSLAVQPSCRPAAKRQIGHTCRSQRAPQRSRTGTPPPAAGGDSDDPDPDPSESDIVTSGMEVQS
jgi:hypothetical protein